MKLSTRAFTLIEIMVSILIFSIVAIGGFQALSSVNIGKVKLTQKADMTKESYFFAEKLFEEVKKGGTVDFEEYFNRKVIGGTLSSGSYITPTGFGNFGGNGTVGTTTYANGLYFCRSGDGVYMGTGGCYASGALNNLGSAGGPQRYGQYAFQFIDHNSNANSDLGDEDGDLKIRGDDDDENLGFGPVVFTGGVNVNEIYLISGDKKHRTYFRWKWKVDPNKPTASTCGGASFGTGCLGTVEFLKLVGKDWGQNHNSGSTSTGSFDGIIDTWLIDPQFTGGTEVIAGSNVTNYRQPLFPDTISVADFQVFVYPNIDKSLAWKDDSIVEFNPYLKIKMKLYPAWKKRAGMKGKVPEMNFSTTVNLTDYFSK